MSLPQTPAVFLLLHSRMPFNDRPYFRRILEFDELVRSGAPVTCTSLAQSSGGPRAGAAHGAAVYATKDGTIVDVLKNVPPCAPDPAPCLNVTPKAKSDTVLEVNAGVADANGAIPGAKLKGAGIPGR